MNTKLKAQLEARFTTGEVEQIESFLNKGFSENGQIAITSIFLFAKEKQKSVAEVLIKCEKEWEKNWQYQHPDIKGDADTLKTNEVSLRNIYSALEIPWPFSIKETEIPTKAMIVTTRNSVYRFGEANDKGERTVSRDGKPLDFTQCKIAFLDIGLVMVLNYLDRPDDEWDTTAVQSIQLAE